MSNVFSSAAIRLCCTPRALTKTHHPKLLSTLTHAGPSTKTSLVNIIPQRCLYPTHVRIEIRSLSNCSRFEVRQSKQKTRRAPSSSSLKPSLKSDNVYHLGGAIDADAWRRYDPAGGLPLPNGELSQPEIDAIFEDTEMKVDIGNYILCVLHWRRMSGALIDVGVDFPRDVRVSRAQAIQGLEYLRETFPTVDEQALGARWAEEESQKMREELQDRAVKLRLYKPSIDSEKAVEEQQEEEAEEEIEESQQGTPEGRARSGTSAAQGLFAAMRARNIEKEEQKIIAQAQKERSLLHAARGPLELGGGVQRQIGVKRYGSMDVVLREPDSVAASRPVERKPWVKYYEEDATLIKEHVVPQMSRTRRLLPSFLVMLLTTGSCIYLSQTYSPPAPETRLFPDIPPAVATIGGLTAVIVGAFLLSRIPQLWRLNNKYFVLVPAYPYALSNVGAIFRHDNVSHLATNVVTLWLVGLSLHDDVGRGTFLAIFLGTGVVGTFSTLTATVLRRQWTTFIYGSSGAVLGTLGALCILRPNNTISIFGYELPIAAWLLLIMVGAVDFVGLFRRRTTRDHVGHLAGLLSGVSAAAYLRSKYSKGKATQHVPRTLEVL